MTDFLILYQLGEAPDEKLRRTDLADKIGLTASGITRVLAPLEKIGLVRREANSRDARVSYVKLSVAGRRVLTEACIIAEEIAGELLTNVNNKRLSELTKALAELGGTIG
ncbi:MarR family winged helix-turn-helix transcriptional regulator [Dyadobacter helix]|nr:MarR family transcriptional regulator [Dyadobacter sp. CECT 9275]